MFDKIYWYINIRYTLGRFPINRTGLAIFCNFEDVFSHFFISPIFDPVTANDRQYMIPQRVF